MIFERELEKFIQVVRPSHCGGSRYLMVLINIYVDHAINFSERDYQIPLYCTDDQ